jgi:hypothetical protein
MGRSVSGITDNNQDKSRQFMENYDLVEGMSIGAHSFIWKVKSRVTSQFFCLKIIKKQKYGRHWRKVMQLFTKYKTIVSIILILFS